MPAALYTPPRLDGIWRIAGMAAGISRGGSGAALRGLALQCTISLLLQYELMSC